MVLLTFPVFLFSFKLLIDQVTAQVPISFALLPDMFALTFDNTTLLGSAATAQECLDLAWAYTNDTKLIEFSSGSCKLARAIYGYRAKSGADPQYWVGMKEQTKMQSPMRQ
ncbi:hypothetical protein AAVH_19246 [Aphelenchoides avenae]|nr:hypothetical protein AAVH_19246 [Aphelenchus avenae]